MNILISGCDGFLGKSLQQFDLTVDEKFKDMKLIPLIKEEFDITSQRNIVEVLNENNINVVINCTKLWKENDLNLLQFYLKQRDIILVQIFDFEESVALSAIDKAWKHRLKYDYKNVITIETTNLYNGDIHSNNIITETFKNIIKEDFEELDKNFIKEFYITDVNKLCEFIFKAIYIKINHKFHNNYFFHDKNVLTKENLIKFMKDRLKIEFIPNDDIAKGLEDFSNHDNVHMSYQTWQEGLDKVIPQLLENSSDVFSNPKDFSTYLQQEQNMSPDDIINGIIGDLFG